MSKVTMSWPDRFALMEHYSPTDEQVCVAFGLSQDELDTARQLKAAGTFRPSTNLDVSQYSTVFSSGSPAVFATTATRSGKGSTTFVKPETAAKKPKVPQKRGRKGDRIQQALLAVPFVQVPVDKFMAEHGVSLAVLRQSKRFMAKLPADVVKQIGRINVRQDKTTKALMIWREQV